MLVAAIVFALLSSLVVWSAPRAGAAPVDCAEGPDWTVGTEAEFNDAINCYNTATVAGRYTISFSGNIAASSGFARPGGGEVTSAFRWITQDVPGFSLTIDGGGFSVWGGVANTTIGINETLTSPVTLTNVFVTGGGLTGVHAIGSVLVVSDSIVSQNANGILVDGSLATIVQSVVVENGGPDVEGHGIINVGETEVRSSVIDSNTGVGVLNEAGETLVADSSVIANDEGGVVNLGFNEPTTDIIDSTIAENGFSETSLFGGVHAAHGTMALRRVTITGNGNGVDAALSATSPGSIVADFVTVLENEGPVEVLGQVELRSSIAERCRFADDGGYNVGGCFATAPIVMEPLADNGCIVSTPQGCPVTFAPTATSPALGRADCSDPADNRDQTGKLRTPQGPGCEAGAVDRDGYTPRPTGDVNCDGSSNIIDALVIAQFNVGIRTDGGFCAVDPIVELNPAHGDINRDRRVNIVDALIIAQCDAGITNPFC